MRGEDKAGASARRRVDAGAEVMPVEMGAMLRVDAKSQSRTGCESLQANWGEGLGAGHKNMTACERCHEKYGTSNAECSTYLQRYVGMRRGASESILAVLGSGWEAPSGSHPIAVCSLRLSQKAPWPHS